MSITFNVVDTKFNRPVAEYNDIAEAVERCNKLNERFRRKDRYHRYIVISKEVLNA